MSLFWLFGLCVCVLGEYIILREKKALLLLIFNDISPQEKFSKRVYISVNFYDKVSTIKNWLKIFNLGNNLTDDDEEFNIDGGFTKKMKIRSNEKNKEYLCYKKLPK